MRLNGKAILIAMVGFKWALFTPQKHSTTMKTTCTQNLIAAALVGVLAG